MIKLDTWPNVLPNDNGIRPAGPSDRCFYCEQKVGKPHSLQCVCVMALIRFDVLIEKAKVGTYDQYKPHWWDWSKCEFHLNKSSWCSDNALDDIKWDSGHPPKVVTALTEDECTCSILEFRYKETIDAGPFISEPMTNEMVKRQQETRELYDYPR